LYGLSSLRPALPFLRGRPMAVLSVSNLFLATAGTIGRVLFISLLCSLSASPVLCSFAPKYTSGGRNIISTLQVALWQTGLDPNSSMQRPNPHCTGTQKYSCAEAHHQNCKIKHLKIRQFQRCRGSPNSACCARSSKHHP